MEGKSNKDPKQEFYKHWTAKQKAGFKNYMAVGFLSCIAFFFFAEAIAGFILDRKTIQVVEMVIFIVLSAILPLVAWYYNEAKFKKLVAENPELENKDGVEATEEDLEDTDADTIETNNDENSDVVEDAEEAAAEKSDESKSTEA